MSLVPRAGGAQRMFVRECRPAAERQLPCRIGPVLPGRPRIETLVGHGGGVHVPGWWHCEQAHSGSREIVFLVRSWCFQQPPLELLCPHRRPWTSQVRATEAYAAGHLPEDAVCCASVDQELRLHRE